MLSAGLAQDAHAAQECFPMRGAVLSAESDGKLTDRVFLEEWSACDGAGAGGPRALPALPGGALSSVEVLRAIVTSYNQGGGLDYQLEQIPGAWVIRPIGVEAVFDTVVSVDSTAHPTIASQQRSVWDQLFEARHIWVGHSPVVDLRNTTISELTLSNAPLVRALSTLYLPLERVLAQGQLNDAPPPRIGMIVRVYDSQNAASTQLVHFEPPD